MQIRRSAAFSADLDAIAVYIAQDNVEAALALLDRIEEAVERLAAHPELGRSGRVIGTRELVVPRTNYVVVYRLKEDAVEVLRALHAARRWPPAQ